MDCRKRIDRPSSVSQHLDSFLGQNAKNTYSALRENRRKFAVEHIRDSNPNLTDPI